MKEQQLQSKIKEYLVNEKDCYVVKYVPMPVYGIAGIPDILCCYKGRFIAIEVKVGNNKPTQIQQSHLGRIKRRGGLAIWVNSLQQVKDFFNELP